MRRGMKFLIASDIHGSAYYCEQLLQAFEREQAARLLLLGDILYHGPRNDLPCDYAPKKVIAMLNSMADTILCVRGNCDTEVDQMVLTFPILADYAVLSAGERLSLIHIWPLAAHRMITHCVLSTPHSFLKRRILQNIFSHSRDNPLFQP